MEKVTAIIFHEHGDPAKVVRTEEVPLPEVGARQARVRMLFAPINPADLNMIEGTYAVRPPLPAVPGGEGVGVVEEIGTTVGNLTPGMNVLLPPGLGSWREALVADADVLMPVPREIPLEQAAMLRVNPATAFRMLHDFVPLQPGDWIIQNVANSGVGRAVIQIAHARGWRTVNVIRRAELIDELRAEGADAVVIEGENVVADVAAATGGATIRLGLNAVGGESALRLAETLAEGGTLVTYGAMSRKPLRMPNGLLIFKDLSFRGFWVTRWYRNATPAQRDEMLEAIFELARRDVIRTPVDRVYPLSNAQEAIHHATQGGRKGKVLFAPASVRD